MSVKECFSPNSLSEALELLEKYGPSAQICAGGTDLFVMMRKGKVAPQYLMDLSSLGLSYIRETNAHISIGAMTSLSETEKSPLLHKEPYTFIQQAAGWIGSPQIRNAATLVGNICTGISSADMAPPLLALDAHVKISGQNGDRSIPLSDFFLSPRKIAVNRGELVSEIYMPRLPAKGYHTFFRKVGTRKELFISILNIAVCLGMEAHQVNTARIAMGLMAPTPIRLYQTEALLTGTLLTEKVIDEALRIMKTEIHPRTSRHATKEYRIMLAENILRRYLTSLI